MQLSTEFDFPLHSFVLKSVDLECYIEVQGSVVDVWGFFLVVFFKIMNKYKMMSVTLIFKMYQKGNKMICH